MILCLRFQQYSGVTSSVFQVMLVGGANVGCVTGDVVAADQKALGLLSMGSVFLCTQGISSQFS
jgi:hypothetical protein